MIRKLCLVSFVLSCSLFFISCQPDLGFTGDDPTPGNDSTYLKMLVHLDTSFPSGLDTLAKYTFQYDGQKRLQFIRVFEYDPGTPGVQFENEERRYYNGNDTLPYKAGVYYDDFPTPGDVDTIFLTYQGGMVSKDSIRSFNNGTTILAGTAVMTFTLAGTNRIVGVKKISLPSGTEGRDSVISIQNRQAGNLLDSKDSIWRGGTATADVFEYQSDFDNKPNPLSRLVLPYTIVNDAYLIGNSSVLTIVRNRNNEIKSYMNATSMWPPGPSVKNYFFQYRADGYPVGIRDDDPDDHFKGIFIYTSL